MDYLRDELETLWRQADLVESQHAGALVKDPYLQLLTAHDACTCDTKVNTAVGNLRHE